MALNLRPHSGAPRLWVAFRGRGEGEARDAGPGDTRERIRVPTLGAALSVQRRYLEEEEPLSSVDAAERAERMPRYPPVAADDLGLGVYACRVAPSTWEALEKSEGRVLGGEGDYAAAGLLARAGRELASLLVPHAGGRVEAEAPAPPPPEAALGYDLQLNDGRRPSLSPRSAVEEERGDIEELLPLYRIARDKGQTVEEAHLTVGIACDLAADEVRAR